MKTFDSLWNELSAKGISTSEESSTVAALSAGTHFITKKIIEEASEVMLAAESQSREALILELSQLIYWAQVLMLDKKINLQELYERL